MKSIAVVTPDDARRGFALAGIRQCVPETLADAPDVLRSLVQDTTFGVVILDERLLDAELRTELRRLERHWPGVVAVLPAPGRVALAGEDYVLQLIRRAIGYQVRLT